MMIAFILGIVAVALSGIATVLSPFLGVWCFIPALLAVIAGIVGMIFGDKNKGEKQGYQGLLMSAVGGGVGFGLFVIWMMLAIMGM